MGLFGKIKEAVAGTDAGSIDHARLGRAIIVSTKVSGTTITSGGIETHVCNFQLEVSLDDTAPYIASCRQRIPVWTMAQIQPGSTTVAVRVDGNDPARVAIDWDSPAPSVRMPAGSGAGSAATVLAEGEGCRVVIQQFQDLGKLSPSGLPVFAFALTVIPQGQAAYVIQVGNPVPPEGLAFMFPGSQLPAKRLPHEPNSVVIDWAAAASQSASTPPAS